MTMPSATPASTTAARAFQEPTRVRFLVVVLCIGMSILLYLNRFALSPATAAILNELDLTKEQFGRTYFVFFFAYALMQVPAGWLSDRYGARATLSLYVVGWSLATLALGFAGGLFAISLARLLLGVAQAGAYPATASLLKRWIPATSRGRANSFVAMGGRAGGLLAFFCTPLLMLLVGRWLGWQTGTWRVVFLFYGSLGFVWAAAFWWLFRDSPRAHPWCNEQEAALVGPPAAVSAAPQGLPVLAMLQSPEVWLLSGFNCAVNIGWIFLVSWLPQYLVETYGDYVSTHLGDKLVVAGTMTALTGLAGIFGGLLGGAATDHLVAAYGLRWGRRLPGVIAGCGVCCLYLIAPSLSNMWAFVGIMIAISFTIDFGLGASWASYQDIGGRHVASVLGVGNMWGNLGAGVFSWLIGKLADLDRWHTVFLISAVAMAANALLWSFFDATRPIVREPQNPA